MKKLILSKENKQINNSIIENNKFIRNFSNCKLEMKNTLTNNDFITLNKDNKIIKMNYINKARNIIKGIQEDNKIIFVDDKGQKTTLNILFTYKNKERNREYVLFYDEMNPDDIIAGYLSEDNEILDIEDDDEYDELEEVLKFATCA